MRERERKIKQSKMMMTTQKGSHVVSEPDPTARKGWFRDVTGS